MNYRLAPEFKYPAALNDAYAAAIWASQNGQRFGWDGSRLVVAGDSVGGNLTAAVALRARDENGPSIVFQLLVTPFWITTTTMNRIGSSAVAGVCSRVPT